MEQDEFVKQRDALLECVPEEMRESFRRYSWNKGHASGYESVLSVLEDLIDYFGEPLKKLGNK